MLRDETQNRLTKRLARGGLVCLCSLMSSGASHSQTQQQSGSDEKGKGEVACRLGEDLVIVEVEVKEVSALPVWGLTLESFRVYEDGKRQEIVYCNRSAFLL